MTDCGPAPAPPSYPEGEVPPWPDRGRQRRAEESVRIYVDRPGIFALEDFVDGIAFLSTSEHARLKLASGELYENLRRHSSPLVEGSAILRVARRASGLYLLVFFRSPSFASYAARYIDHEPIFDRRARRWHGMGLRMCRNLSSSLVLRGGTVCDRIIVRF